MRILSRVCADFYDVNNNLIHRFTRRDLGVYNDVPDAIRQDPLFQMLVDDGSILLADTPIKQKTIENDPYAGATADGRSTDAATVKAKTKAKTNSDFKNQNSELKSENGAKSNSEKNSSAAP